MTLGKTGLLKTQKLPSTDGFFIIKSTVQCINFFCIFKPEESLDSTFKSFIKLSKFKKSIEIQLCNLFHQQI